MGTCCETICKHRILFPSIQHLAWLPQGRLQEKQNEVKIAIFGLMHWLKHRITRKLYKIDRHILRGVWQALNCLSIHATYCVIATEGRLQGKQKCRLRYVKTGIFCTCGSNNWESVEHRWVHAETGLASTELSFHSCNVLRDCHRGVPGQTKNEGGTIFSIVVRITGKLL